MKRVRISTESSDRLMYNPSEDACPVCGAKLSDVYWSWRVQHGLAEASCCHTPYRIKRGYVDPTTDPTGEVRRHNEKINGSTFIELNIDEVWIEPLRQALKELNTKYIDDAGVAQRAKEIRQAGSE